MSYGGKIYDTLGLNASTNSQFSGHFTNTVGAITGCDGPKNSVLAASNYPGEQIINKNMNGGGSPLTYNFDSENIDSLNMGLKGSYMPVSSKLVLEKNDGNMDSSKQIMYGGKKNRKHTLKKSMHKIKVKKNNKTKRKHSLKLKHNKKHINKTKHNKNNVMKKHRTKKNRRNLVKQKGGMNINEGYTFDTSETNNALTNPIPIKTYNNCHNNYNHYI